MSEALNSNANDYKSFNDFFIRQLNSLVRPIDTSSRLCSPVDGTISQTGKINNQTLVQAKGMDYSLKTLVANDVKLIETFKSAHYTTIYLSPRDYHRVHCPIDAIVKRMIYVPGKLFSVNQATTHHKKDLFSRNERLIIELETKHGPCCLIMVGAMIVGNMNVIWAGDIKRTNEIRYFDYQKNNITLKKGQELGHFKLGSTVILLMNHSSESFWKKTNGDTIKLGEPLA